MRRRVDLLFGVAGHAGGIDLLPGVHDAGGGAVAAGGPRLIGDMGVARAVAIGAADLRPRVCDSELLLRVIGMAHEAPTVVDARFAGGSVVFALVRQRQGLVLKEQGRRRRGRLSGNGRCVVSRTCSRGGRGRDGRPVAAGEGERTRRADPQEKTRQGRGVITVYHARWQSIQRYMRAIRGYTYSQFLSH